MWGYTTEEYSTRSTCSRPVCVERRGQGGEVLSREGPGEVSRERVLETVILKKKNL